MSHMHRKPTPHKLHLSWTAASVCLVCVIVKEGFWKGMFSCYISSLLFKIPLYLLKLFWYLNICKPEKLYVNKIDSLQSIKAATLPFGYINEETKQLKW